jgi:hypothetical protein
MANERERKIKCTNEGCGAEVTVEIPEGLLINKPTVSMVVLVHQEVSVCPNCGTSYGFVMRGLNLRTQDVAWAPIIVQKKDEPDIIIPPTSLSQEQLNALLKKKGN